MPKYFKAKIFLHCRTTSKLCQGLPEGWSCDKIDRLKMGFCVLFKIESNKGGGFVELQISNRMSGLQPSAIREILKVTGQPNMISFAAGNPASETFPISELHGLAGEILENKGEMALQYGVTEGYEPLREQTKKRLSQKYGMVQPSDELMILSGGQQGIDLLSKCLLNEGDVVLCEAYSFIGALNTFRSYGARLVGIPLEEDGMNLDVLEDILQHEPNVKLIYTIPTFQNPMGITMSEQRRKKLYELAVQYDVMIVEDSPYFELRYSGEAVPAIKTWDRTGHVIYLGSYSKIISPGLRVGFLCAQADLVAKLVVAKQCADVHNPLLTQMLVSHYLERYDLDEHIAFCCNIYREKRNRMLEKMELLFPKEVSFTRPEGGLFLWCNLPETVSGMEFCKQATESGVACVPGGTFDPNGNPDCPCFRVNFSLPTLEQIDRGVSILAECMKKWISN
jgi:2-aminoadipate transaminase